MNSFNPYAAGKKVYRGSAPHAHMGGGLDPIGYVIRERLKKSQGNVSQQRSGMAAAALNRLQNGGPQTAQASGKQKPGKPGKPKPKPPKNPNVMVTPNGQLNLPWNMQNALAAVSAQQDLNSQLQGNMQASQQFNTDYRQQMRSAGQANERMQEGLLNSAAGRGMAFSSGYGEQVADAATSYNDWQSNMENQRAMFRTGIQTSNTEARTDFLDTLRRLAISQGLDLEKYAGQLGLGRARNPKEHSNVKRPRRHHRRKPHGGK